MKLFRKILPFLPIVILSLVWEYISYNSPRTNFLFSSPSRIIIVLYEKIISGELIGHTIVTAYEAFLGLFLGVFVGSVIGFIMLYFPLIARVSKYYILSLSSIPIFALAPMMIIWFGTELQMKIAMAFFATVFVAIFQALQGGQNVSKQESDFFELNNATLKQKFWILTLPSSMEWLIQSLKINSGLSILGAFIGEFIASEKGLGYIILKASGLYDVTYVLASTICIIALTLIFNFTAHIIEKNKLRLIRIVSVRSNY